MRMSSEPAGGAITWVSTAQPHRKWRCGAAHDAAMRNVALKLVHVVAPVAFLEGAPADYARWQDEQAKLIIERAHQIVAGCTAQTG
jgi:hypothetical protein